MKELFEGAISGRIFPGAAYAFGTASKVSTGHFGTLTYGGSVPVSNKTWWDLASLTKVICTTTLVAQLVARGFMDLDASVSVYLPEFRHDTVTVRHLLTHTSGLIPFRRWAGYLRSLEEIQEAVFAERLETEPGSTVLYSDLSFILLGWIVDRIMGKRLDEVFCYPNLRFFRELPSDLDLFAPTEPIEPWREPAHMGIFTRGQVHDPSAYLMGGVAGHAGLFGTLIGVVDWVQSLLRLEVLDAQMLRVFTTRQVGCGTRALGWDTRSEFGSSTGSHFSLNSFGHTGFTGTSLWIDPEKHIFAILLSNRVHPNADSLVIKEFRPRFHDAVAALMKF